MFKMNTRVFLGYLKQASILFTMSEEKVNREETLSEQGQNTSGLFDLAKFKIKVPAV